MNPGLILFLPKLLIFGNTLLYMDNRLSNRATFCEFDSDVADPSLMSKDWSKEEWPHQTVINFITMKF